MTLQLELSPETEAQLFADAQAHGIEVERYAQQLLKKALDSEQRQEPSGKPEADRQSFRVFLDALASKAPENPQLRDETFSRAMIYGDHD